MEAEQINKELKREIRFLAFLYVVFFGGIGVILGLLQVYSDFDYRSHYVEILLILIPLALIFAYFSLKHMYNKNLLRPELKVLFERKK